MNAGAYIPQASSPSGLSFRPKVTIPKQPVQVSGNMSELRAAKAPATPPMVEITSNCDRLSRYV